MVPWIYIGLVEYSPGPCINIIIRVQLEVQGYDEDQEALVIQDSVGFGS